ncbi:MAG: S-methyl-5-thioribose-1-phosphate isomerase [Polyangiaceae bacterium]|nr:S-methyl-5-thioribose-1-phosphate isomerase [Polyangiaceae bacterium]
MDDLNALCTIREDGDAIIVLDQTCLPEQTAFVRLTSLAEAAQAIRTMQVRGAPLIGATAAYGVALALRAGIALAEASEVLAATRPTAVNLHWALGRMKRALEKSPAGTCPDCAADCVDRAWQEARAIAHEDAEANAAIGRYGLPLLARFQVAARSRRSARSGPEQPAAALRTAPQPPTKRSRQIESGLEGTLRKPIEVMTHCNAGWLATVAHGTALAPIYAAHAAGIALHVWVSETRPRNQGLLTAWELRQAGVAHTLIADNAAGLLLMQGKVDLVIVGADRIAANGDVANKIGTYLKALAAHAHAIPFYVAAPVSTIDFDCPNGAAIPIEERNAAEFGKPASRGDTPIANPAFDITPAALISGIITEQGVFSPKSLPNLLADIQR